MDKACEELIKDVRMTVQRLAEIVNEIDDALAHLADRAARTDSPPVPQTPYTVPLPRTGEDPRRPYLAGRWPRRDGTSYGTVVTPVTGGTHGEETPTE